MVLKGCEKRVIHVKSSNNPLFEEAYFFLKHQNDTLLPPTELWREAEKIVNQSLLENGQPTPVFLPGESQGRGSPVGCHLWVAQSWVD